jgi:hypothetical protein
MTTAASESGPNDSTVLETNTAGAMTLDEWIVYSGGAS